jgi:hypothetical protein
MPATRLVTWIAYDPTSTTCPECAAEMLTVAGRLCCRNVEQHEAGLPLVEEKPPARGAQP